MAQHWTNYNFGPVGGTLRGLYFLNSDMNQLTYIAGDVIPEIGKVYSGKAFIPPVKGTSAWLVFKSIVVNKATVTTNENDNMVFIPGASEWDAAGELLGLNNSEGLNFADFVNNSDLPSMTVGNATVYPFFIETY